MCACVSGVFSRWTSSRSATLMRSLSSTTHCKLVAFVRGNKADRALNGWVRGQPTRVLPHYASRANTTHTHECTTSAMREERRGSHDQADGHPLQMADALCSRESRRGGSYFTQRARYGR